MARKKQKGKDKYVKVKNSNLIKEASDEADLYISEGIKKSKVFEDNRKKQLEEIKEAKGKIKSIKKHLDKLTRQIKKPA